MKRKILFLLVLLQVFSVLSCKKTKKNQWWLLLLLNQNHAEETTTAIQTIEFSVNQENPVSTNQSSKKLKALVMMSIYPAMWQEDDQEPKKYWIKLISAANSNYYVIVYPPYDQENSDYTDALGRLALKGAIPIAYVDTNYGNVNKEDVKTKIDGLFYNYSGKVRGIYFSRVSSLYAKYNPDTGEIEHLYEYHKELYDYVKSRYPNSFVVLGHGSIPDTSYFSIADINLLFVETESMLEGFFTKWNSLPWKSLFQNEDFAIVVRNVQLENINSIIQRSKEKNIYTIYLSNKGNFEEFPDDEFWNALIINYGN
ncbi:MAG: spherulation-specific family 4 protein [Leptospiraceae bacterium]|nr:spherulation-specific family 4 protein [Leptospiraceae bacterium]MDW7976218.1 spherulation-specific family 4 protein [Leptospiraceae bacterium]